MVASLAYSADWLGHEVRKLRGNGGCSGAGGSGRVGSKRGSRAGLSGGSSSASSTWVDHVVGELFQVIMIPTHHPFAFAAVCSK